MKKVFLCLIAGALICITPACKSDKGDDLSHHHHHNHETEHQHEPAHEHEAEEAVSEHEHDDGEISLSHEAAERFGVSTETVKSAKFNDVLKVSGNIVPSPTGQAVVVAPSSGIITFTHGIDRGTKVSIGSLIATVKSSGISGGDPNQAAKATYDAAKRELDRLKPLYEEKLITASDYNAALRAYEEAKAAYSANASSGRISSPISGVITSIDAGQGQYVETGAQIATVSSSSKLTLRADVPEKYYGRLSAFNDATVVLPYSDTTLNISAMNGKRIASDGSARASIPGYVPVYFTFDNDGSALPGSNVEVYLKGTETDNVISVPISSLSEQQGEMYVFVRLDEDCYRKVQVKTGRNDGERIEILSGLKDGDNVVTKGTTTVRIAESSGVVPEGHSHNH